MSSEFWSTIIGSLVGGAIALAIQLMVFRDARKERKREADELTEATALSLFLKLQSCGNDLAIFAQHVADAAARANAMGWEMWQAMVPIPNLPPHQDFKAEEMIFLIRSKNFDLYNRIRDVEVTHHSSIVSFQLYLDRRTELGSQMGSVMNGDIGAVALNAQQLQALGPLMADVKGLAASITETASEYSVEALKTWKDYTNTLEGLIDQRFELDFSRKDAIDQKIQAKTP
jgi:hypothetical protein